MGVKHEKDTMKLHKTSRRLAATKDEECLRRATRDIGHELPRRRLPLLRKMLALLSSNKSDQDGFVLGYKTALSDLVRAYCSSIEEELDKEVLLGYVLNSPHALKFLISEKSPYKATDVSRILKISKYSAFRLLKALRNCGIVEDIVPPGGSKYERIYILTLRGHWVTRKIEELRVQALKFEKI